MFSKRFALVAVTLVMVAVWLGGACNRGIDGIHAIYTQAP